MSDYRPFDQWDYRLDDNLFGEGEPPLNQLLGEDLKPHPDLCGSSVRGLAAIASVLHEHAPKMKANHLEKAVWWLKEWKSCSLKRYRTQARSFEYRQMMEAQKNTAEFLRAGKLALRLSYGSQAFATLFGAAAVVTLVLFLEDYGWGVRSGALAATLIFAALAAGFRDSARDIWQLQDRKYFLNCLRLAEDTEDLLDAGLFALHPATENVDSAAEYLAFKEAIRDMQHQLGDALYFDHDHQIRKRFNEQEIANSINWPTHTAA